MNQKIPKHFTKSATHSVRCKIFRSACAVRRCLAYHHNATVQGRRGILLECAHSVRFPKACVVSEPAEVERVAGNSLVLHFVRELDELFHGGFRGDLVRWELDCFLRNGVVLWDLRAPKPVDAVAQPSIPVKPVRLANQLPIGNHDGKRHRQGWPGHLRWSAYMRYQKGLAGPAWRRGAVALQVGGDRIADRDVATGMSVLS